MFGERLHWGGSGIMLVNFHTLLFPTNYSTLPPTIYSRYFDELKSTLIDNKSCL